jgi:hypothetical protein
MITIIIKWGLVKRTDSIKASNKQFKICVNSNIYRVARKKLKMPQKNESKRSGWVLGGVRYPQGALVQRLLSQITPNVP